MELPSITIDNLTLANIEIVDMKLDKIITSYKPFLGFYFISSLFIMYTQFILSIYIICYKKKPKIYSNLDTVHHPII